MFHVLSLLTQKLATNGYKTPKLCSGTDPIEGAALAAAILESFRNFGATLSATTHYAELKAYALDTEGVENACSYFFLFTECWGVTEKVAWLTSRKSHGAVCYTGDSYSLEHVQDPQGFIGLGFSSGYIDFFHLQ